MADFVNEYLLQYYQNLRNYSVLVIGPNSFPIPTLKKCLNIIWNHNYKMLQPLIFCLHKICNEMTQWIINKTITIKTVILPVIIYGCETWTLTLREEKRLQVFENKVLRKIFWPKRDDERGEWRRLHNGELHDLYGKPDIMRIANSRRLRWAGHVTGMGNERGAWKLLVGKPEGKRPVGRPGMIGKH